MGWRRRPLLIPTKAVGAGASSHFWAEDPHWEQLLGAHSRYKPIPGVPKDTADTTHHTPSLVHSPTRGQRREEFLPEPPVGLKWDFIDMGDELWVQGARPCSGALLALRAACD